MAETEITGRVLIADDEAHTRTLLRDLFESWGFEVLLAEDGEATLRMLEERPSIVILDLMMPKVDGFGVLKRMRSRAHLAEVPVILLTARDDVEGRLQGIEAGADDYVTKPFRIGEFRQRLDAVMAKRSFPKQESAGITSGDTQSGIDLLTVVRDDIEREIGRAQESNLQLCSLIVALDAPPLGTSLGAHRGNDDLYVTLRKVLREADRVFKLDSDSFIVLMPETGKLGATKAAERLIYAVQTQAQSSARSISVGIADYPRWGMGRPEELVWASLRALRQARREGTCQIGVASDDA